MLESKRKPDRQKRTPQARKDYDHARAACRKIIAESFDERK
jgi:hypothetical protein